MAKPPLKPKNEYQDRTRFLGTPQILGFLVEECGEVMAAVGKAQRWGLNSYNPELSHTDQETNRKWIRRELEDLKYAIQLVEEVL
jgi:NTP pyrophosphatase (non-canonical NTP hydrolase)